MSFRNRTFRPFLNVSGHELNSTFTFSRLKKTNQMMSKKLLATVLYCIAFVANLTAQCDCVTTGNCPQPMIDNGITIGTLEVVVNGPNDLSQSPLQQVCLTITHTWIGDLSISLISPSGVEYLIMADVGNNYAECGTTQDNAEVCIVTGTNNPLTNNTEYLCNSASCSVGTCCLNGNWTVPCGGVSSPLTGAIQAPNCDLNDFNVPGQPANGTWRLSVLDACMNDSGNLENFSLTFAGGQYCFVCEADGGTLDTTSQNVCLGDGNPNIVLPPIYGPNGPLYGADSALYGYTYAIVKGGTILSLSNDLDFSNFTAGDYQIYGLSYLIADGSLLPSIVGMSFASANTMLESGTPDFCGDFSGNGVNLTVLPASCTSLCDTNFVQNGSFDDGIPNGSDQNIQLATDWGPIWDSLQFSTADFYNTTTIPAPFPGPYPTSQGQFAAFWVGLQGDQSIWREGAMNELLTTILPNSGCYDLSLKLACIFEQAFGSPGLCIYGVNAPGGFASGTITDGIDPDNLNIFAAGSTVELASYAIPSSCDANFQTLNFQFNSSILPPNGITHLFITRCDGMSGAEFVAIDDVCLSPGSCIEPCNVNFDWSLLDSCGTMQVAVTGSGENLNLCWDFDGDGSCDSDLPSTGYQFPNAGNYEVCLTYDNGLGCIGTVCQEVNAFIIQDAPQVLCPPNVIVDCSNPYYSAIPVVENSACSFLAGVQCIRSDGEAYEAPYPPCSTTLVTCTATNKFGSNSCQFTVSTVDNQPPIIQHCPDDVQVECDNPTHPNTTGYPVFFDNCSANPSFIFNDSLIGDFPCDAYLRREWAVIDQCGNMAFCTQNVYLIDTVPPVIICPPNVTVLSSESTDPDNTGTFDATDNCATVINISSFDEITGQQPCPITINRTWKAQDQCDLVSQCVQIITVDCEVNSTEPNLAEQIRIYPNPTGDKVVLEISDSIDEIVDAEIMDACGRRTLIGGTLRSQSPLELFTQDLPPAIYIVKLTDTNGRSWHRKLVKN